MSQVIYYKVYVRLIRNLSQENIEFVTEVKKFKNTDPIVARRDAFDFYQNYIDVLLQGLGVECQTDYDIRAYLKPFYNRDGQVGYIGVSMVMDEDFEFDELPKPYGLDPNEFEIHCIPSNELRNLDQMMYNLVCEYQYYKYFNYNRLNDSRDVQFYGDVDPDHGGYDPNLENYTILSTPFDWSRYIEPRKERVEFENEFDWSGFHFEEERTEVVGESHLKKISITSDLNLQEQVIDIINKGEGTQLEFKPSLLYDFKTGNSTPRIKNIIAKTICAFLNARGGYLLIGVTNEGQIDGLENDYKLAPSNNNPRDYFNREFTRTLLKFFPPKIVHYIDSRMVSIDSKEVFQVVVHPARSPTFIKGEKGKEFYFRSGAASEQIIDIEAIVAYCREHFEN